MSVEWHRNAHVVLGFLCCTMIHATIRVISIPTVPVARPKALAHNKILKIGQFRNAFRLRTDHVYAVGRVSKKEKKIHIITQAQFLYVGVYFSE